MMDEQEKTPRRIKLIVQYDGRGYCGWQRQPSDPTVQATLEGGLSKLLGQPIRVFAAGRTDTGVHAAAMPVHFDCVHGIPAENIPVAVSKFLPEAISVLSAEAAGADFDARRQAIMRWYRYQVLQTAIRRPLGPRAWHVYRALDLGAMEAGLGILRGHHDFSGFRSSECQARRTELTLEQASMRVEGDLIAFDFKCRSFLHHMIRFMVGTLISLGHGQMDLERVRRILERGERPELILCAPPEGLCLMAVGYDEMERTAILEAQPGAPSF